MQITAFNNYVSAQGKADMVVNDYAGDLVELTDRYGDIHVCYIHSVSATPDNEPLVVVELRGSEGLSHVFADDIVKVNTIGKG